MKFQEFVEGGEEENLLDCETSCHQKEEESQDAF